MSIHPHALPPPLDPRIQDNLIGKRIRLAGRNGRYMILVPVDNGHDLERRLLERGFHCFEDFFLLWWIRKKRG